MGTTFQIDTEKRVIFIKRFGLIQPKELNSEIQKIIEHPDYKNVDKVFSDFSESNLSKLSITELVEHAMFCRKAFKDLEFVAVVSPNNLPLGISSMFDVLSKIENLKIFRKKEDALYWLDIKDLPDDFI